MSNCAAFCGLKRKTEGLGRCREIQKMSGNVDCLDFLYRRRIGKKCAILEVFKRLNRLENGLMEITKGAVMQLESLFGKIRKIVQNALDRSE